MFAPNCSPAPLPLPEACERTLQAETKQNAHGKYIIDTIFTHASVTLSYRSIYGMKESRDSDRFLVNTQIQSHALLHWGFGTSVPFIFVAKHTDTVMQSFSLKFTNCLKWLIETLANYITDWLKSPIPSIWMLFKRGRTRDSNQSLEVSNLPLVPPQSQTATWTTYTST